MKFKSKILCILLLSVLLFSLSAVAANENTTQSFKEVSEDPVSVSVESNNEILGISNSEESLGATDDNEILCATDDGTFKALQDKINNADGVLVLENDYKNTDNFNPLGITISKSLTIDGNGYTIDALKKGRIFQVTASNVTLKNINFNNGNSDLNTNKAGGAIYWTGGYGTLLNCNFTNNIGTDGSAVSSYSSYGTIDKCSFINNDAKTSFIGAISYAGNNGSISNCFFSKNDAGGAAAISLSGKSSFVFNCSFVENTAHFGIFSLGGSDNSAINCSISNNLVQYGAILVGGTNCSVINSSFKNNRASGTILSGGAIRWSGTLGKLINCSFVGNTAHNGGAIEWGYNTEGGSIINCSFVGNSAQNKGGALSIEAKNCILDNCSFIDNSAVNGGAVSWTGANGVLGNSSFIDNSASSGDAVYWTGANGVLANSFFIDNSASSGDAVYWTGANGVLGNSSFENCSAVINVYNSGSRYGSGAVYWAGVNGTLGNSSFENCSAVINVYGSSSGHGSGAVYWAGADGTLGNSSFENCSAVINVYGSGPGYSSSAGAVYWAGVNGTLGNSSFVNCSAIGSGGAVWWDGANGTLSGCNFTDCSAVANSSSSSSSGRSDSYSYSYGGAVFWNGTGGSLSGCNFTDCSAVASSSSGTSYSYGGAVYWNGDDGSLSGCSFTDCSAVASSSSGTSYSYGGAVYWNGDDGSLSGCSFVNCSAVASSSSSSSRSYSYGGAVYWNGTGGSLSGCNFTVCSARKGDGGARYWYGTGGAVNWDGARGVLGNCSFVNCSIGFTGGAVNWDGARGVLGNCSFVNCSSESSSGGAVYWYGSGGVLGNCSFVNCSAGWGGAVFCSSGSVGVLSNCSFVNCSARLYGGAVWNNGGVLGNCSFVNCSAGYAGGAVFWITSLRSDVLGNCSFVNCSVGSHGGAVYWQGANGVLDNCSFVNCSVTGNYAIGGGAVYRDSGADGVLGNCSFVNCSSVLYGGAVYWRGTDGVLGNCSFTDCSANIGGAVFWGPRFSYNINDGLNGVLGNCNFTDCSADYGGAVYWNATNGVLGNCSFVNCSAVSGGAVYCAGSVVLSGCNFTNNSASQFGGVIYSYGRTSIDVAYFNGNTATQGSAIYKTGSSDFIISNTVFGRNRANSDKIVIEIEGNETNCMAVKIAFYGNDNIANAIWNNGTLGSVKLANITCEFSYDGIGREYKTFNKYDTPKAVESDHYVKGSDELWQSPLENAQLIDINITDSDGNVIYSIVNGTETKNANVVRNLLKFNRPGDNKPLNVTDVEGKISIKLSNLKSGSYKISAKHQDDDYYTMTSGDDSFVINNAELVIKKSADVVNVGNNSMVNYTITVKNTGSLNATNVNITDFLPQNLTYSRWGIIEGNGALITKVSDYVWSVSKIANDGSVSIWFIAKVNTNTAGIITNTVGVNCSENTVFVTDKEDINVVPVNLTLVKSASSNNVTVGENLTFTITITNNAVVDATNIEIIDVLDSAFKFDGVSTNLPATFNNNEIRWIIANLKGGESLSISFNVTAVKVGNFENVATVSSNENNTKKYNKTHVTINKAPSFVSASDVNVTYGETIIVNVNSVNATGVAYKVIDANNVVVKDGVLKPGENIVGLDLAVGVYTVELTTVVDGNHRSVTNKSKITVNSDSFAFSLKKSSLTPTVVLGQSVLFEIVIENTGKAKLTDVYFTEESFDGLIYDSAIGEGIWTHKFENGKHTWTFNNVLEPGEIIELTLRFNTTASGKFTNFVSAASSQTEVLTANAMVNVLKPEFKVEKIVLTPKVSLGEQVIYEIVIRNTGEADLTNIVVEEMPDASLVFDHYDDKGLFKHSVVSGKHIWTLDKLAKGNYAGFILYFNTTATGNISNKISVKSDEVPENTTTSNNTTVLLPAFTLEKISLNRTVVLGQNAEFEIVIRNTGKVELTNVYFTEDSFDGLIYDSAIGEGIWTHKFENGKHTWTFNDVLEPGEIIELTLRFNTTASGEFTNFVSAGSDQTEVLTANASVTVLKPEFKVEKIVLTPKVALGEQVIYEIVIRNTGEADLTNIVVEEMPDASLVFDHYIDGGLFKHSIVSGKHIWTLDKLAKGNYAGFRLYFNTTATGNISNKISVKSDEIPENTTTSNNTTVLLPAFGVEKICLDPDVLVGNQTQFQIVIKNTGKIQLTDVYFTEESFDGLIYDSAVGEGIWTHKFENGKHTWTLNNALDSGEIIGLTLIFNTTAKGNFTNFVSASSNQTEVLTANATVHVFEGKVPEPPVQNLTGMDVFKTVITQEAVLGGQITFQIVVHNTGNTNLENVKISEILPEGLVYDYFTDYLGLWRYNNDLTWSATRAILPGEYAGFFVTFNTTKAGRFENHIVVMGDNTNITPANTSFDVLNPSFTIEKILVQDNILNGTQATFEIVIHNTGNASLSGVTVKEYGFNGLIYNNFVDNLGVWTYNGDLSWTLNAKLAPGEYAVLSVTFYTTTPGNFTNFVSGSSNETGILIANATVHVLDDKTGPEQNSSDDYKMDVFKTVITQETVLGGQITFQIVVHNTGNRNLENVKVSEILPDGLVYEYFTDYLGLWTYNGDLTWSAVRAIVSGEYVGFFVTFNTTKAGRFENHIVVTADKGNSTAGNSSFEVLNPDFTIEKILVEDNIANGGQATFEIVIHNTGNAPLTNLTVREYFFEGLVYNHFTDYLDLWTYNGDLSWTMNSKLLPGEYAGFYVTFNTTIDGKFTNIVVANSTECGDKFSNNATVSVHNETVDIRMVCLTPLVIVGNQVTFEITVQNTGNIPITVLKISEYDFEGLIYDHYMDYLGHWINDGITWTLNTTLVPGEVTSLFVVFNTTKTGNFTNVILANNDVLDTNDLLSANSLEDGIFVSAGVEVVKPEYTIEIVALNKTVENGEEVTFEVIVHNIGKVDVSNITIRDIPSDGLDYVGFIDSENFWSKNSDLSWDLAKVLVPGQYSSFYIVFNTTKSGILENTIVSDNLTSKATVEVKDPVVPTNPGLIVEVEVTTDPITGQPVLKVTVTNIGNVDLDNVFVKANMPEGLKYGDYYSYDSIWNFNNDEFALEGLLKVGESKSFFIEILGEPGDYQIKIDAGFNGTIADIAIVSVKVLDNSTPGNNVTPEVPKDNNVKQLKSSVAAGDNATGNPILMILLVLIALGITRLRRKD